MACCISPGTAKIPTLATASASVRTVKKARALRRVRSVTDLRTRVEAMTPSSRLYDEAVADRHHTVRPRRQAKVVRHVQHGRALLAHAREQVEHLRRRLRVEVA